MTDDEGDRSRTETLRMESWEQFQAYVEGLEEPTRKLWDEVWFRGQRDATWKLKTTLERRSEKISVVRKYLGLISEIRPAIETFAGMVFDFPETRLALENHHSRKGARKSHQVPGQVQSQRVHTI